MKDERGMKKKLVPEPAKPRRRVQNMETSAENLRTAEEKKEKELTLLSSINSAQAQFITGENPSAVFDGLLKDILDLTCSEYGFIGEVLHADRGAPYLRVRAATNIAWDRGTRSLYRKTASGGVEFHNLDTLIGQVIKTGKPLVSNRPMRDRRRGGLPDGHPLLNAFLGVPVYRGEKLLGMVGLANRPGGYDRTLARFLRPFTAACANILEAGRTRVDLPGPEGELTAASDMLRSIADGIEDPVMIIDKEFRVLLLNRAAREFYPEHAGEDGPLYCHRVSHGNAGPCFLHEDCSCPHSEVFATGRAASVVHRHYKGDGKLRHMEITAVPLRGGDNEVRGIIEFSKDITERRVMEEALVDSESRFRKIFEHAATGMVIVDAEGRIMDSNPAYRDMLGYDEKELRGMDIGDITHPGDVEKDRASLKEMVEGRRAYYRTEKRYIRKDGRIILGRLSESMLRGRKGDAKLAVGLVEDITERKQAEKALQESEGSYRRLALNLPGIVFRLTLGEQNRMQFFNDMVLPLTGYGTDELRGGEMCDFESLIIPEDRERVLESVKKAIEDDVPYEVEYCIRHKDGWYRYFIERGRPTRGTGGAATSIDGFIFDITERRRAEKALIAERDRAEFEKGKAEAILEAIADPVSIQDTDFKVLYQNRAHRAIKGDRGGQYCHEAYHGKDTVCEGCHLALSFKDGKVNKVEKSNITDKGVKLFEITASPVRDSAGNIVAGIEAARDITQRKRMEEELRQAKAFLESIISAEPECVKLMDSDCRVLDMNPAGLAMVEADDPGQVKGQVVLDLVDPEYRDAFREFTEAVCGGEAGTLTFRITGMKGTPRWLESHAVPFREGSRRLMLSVTRDITQRKRMEEALRQSVEDKDMLIKEVHHRVKNNLAIIASLLKLQSREIEDVKSRSILDESRNRVRSMSLIHEKLYRSEDVKSINFREYVRELAVQLFRAYEAGPDVRLAMDVPDVLLDIDTVIPLGLIVNELVSNALKYAFADGGGTVSISFKPEGEGQYTLVIKDDGVGFPDGLDFGNTGTLGMQIVISLAAQLDGSVEFDGAVGAEFMVSLTDRGFSRESGPSRSESR